MEFADPLLCLCSKFSRRLSSTASAKTAGFFCGKNKVENHLQIQAIINYALSCIANIKYSLRRTLVLPAILLSIAVTVLQSTLFPQFEI